MISRKAVFAISYFLLIPIFAGIYWVCLPNDFYHSTVQFEYVPMNRSATRILDGLQKSIIERISSSPKGGTCGGWTLLTDSVHVHSLSAHDGKIAFGVSGEMLQETPRGLEQSIFHERYAMTLNQRIIAFPKNSEPVVSYMLVPDTPIPTKYPFGEDPFFCIFPASETMAGTLQINQSLSNDLNNFASAVRGFPAHVEGQFWRLLYFSGTTVTTLGFGDIVPLTTRARLAVLCESILGILLMGLFLNALGREIKTR